MSCFRPLGVVLAALLASGAAQAATINFTGINNDAGTVAIGQQGTVTTTATSFGGITYADMLQGYLPADSEITFSYEIFGNHASQLGTNAYLYSYASYDYTANHIQHYGTSVDTATAPGTGFGSSIGHIVGRGIDALEAAPLVLATSNIEGTDFGTTTIINNTASSAYFMSALEELTSLTGRLAVTYTVTALSAVPLPASLPLFVLAMAVLFVFGVRRNARS